MLKLLPAEDNLLKGKMWGMVEHDGGKKIYAFKASMLYIASSSQPGYVMRHRLKNKNNKHSNKRDMISHTWNCNHSGASGRRI